MPGTWAAIRGAADSAARAAMSPVRFSAFIMLLQKVGRQYAGRRINANGCDGTVTPVTAVMWVAHRGAPGTALTGSRRCAPRHDPGEGHRGRRDEAHGQQGDQDV